MPNCEMSVARECFNLKSPSRMNNYGELMLSVYLINMC